MKTKQKRILYAGKISKAIRCISDESKGRVMSCPSMKKKTKDDMTKSVHDIFLEEHSQPKEAKA